MLSSTRLALPLHLPTFFFGLLVARILFAVRGDDPRLPSQWARRARDREATDPVRPGASAGDLFLFFSAVSPSWGVWLPRPWSVVRCRALFGLRALFLLQGRVDQAFSPRDLASLDLSPEISSRPKFLPFQNSGCRPPPSQRTLARCTQTPDRSHFFVAWPTLGNPSLVRALLSVVAHYGIGLGPPIRHTEMGFAFNLKSILLVLERFCC